MSRGFTQDRQGHAVEGEQQPQNAADEQLHGGVLEAVGCVGAEAQPAPGGDVGEVHEPHGGDEADRSPDADGREIPDRVVSVAGEDREGHRVREGDRRHVERHAQGVEREERGEAEPFGVTVSVKPRPQHEEPRQRMAQAEQFFSGDVLVGDDAQDGRHEDRDDALDRVEPGDVVAQSRRAEVVADAGEVGAPHGELQEVHDG